MRRITLPIVLTWLGVGVWLAVDDMGNIVLFLVGSAFCVTAFIIGVGWILAKIKK